MHDMVITELRSLLSQYKDIVSIKPEKSYKLVTISNKGVIHLRNIVHGVEIKEDTAYRIKAGSFIYSRLAAHTGSFGLVPPELDGAIVTNEMPVFEIDQGIILSDYLLYLLRQKKFLNILFQLTKGMGRVRIKEESFLNIKLPIHEDIVDQKRVIESLDSKFENIEALDKTHLEQIGIISQTRQALLQEAIEGKLTANWRLDHPELIKGDNHALKLLEKLKLEKEQLTKEGKIRKEKPLPQINDDEKPFVVPEGWVWSRLGDILKTFIGGFAYSSMLFKKEGHIQVLRLGNIRPNSLRLNESPVFISNDYANETSEFEIREGDILITMTGTRGKRDYCYTVMIPKQSFEDRRLFLNQRVGCIRLMPCVINSYINHALKHEILLNMVFNSATGSANQANIGSTILKDLLIPIPPLAEQEEIVRRIDNLMAMIDELEKQVSERKGQSEMLMQSVLREAFTKS